MFRKGSLGRKIFVGGFAGAFFVGGGAAVVYRRRRQENNSVSAESFNASQNQSELKTALDNLYAPDGTPNKPIIKLYRYTTCPFCGVVKAFLDTHKIPHELIEVDPMFKGQLGEIAYKKVPNLQFNIVGHWGPFIADSEIIVNTLAKAVGIGSQVKDENVLLWRGWARRELVKFLVLNLNDSLFNAWMSYGYIDQFDTIPTFNKYFLKVMGAPVMYLVAKFMTAPTLKKQGLLKDGDDIRDKLMECVEKFAVEVLNDPAAVEKRMAAEAAKASSAETPAAAEGGEKKDAAAPPAKKTAAKPQNFHGGDKPDLADIDVYGVLQSIRGHYIYDDIYASTEIRGWLDRMDAATGKQPYIIMNPEKIANHIKKQ